jgi:hypothetical protein
MNKKRVKYLFFFIGLIIITILVYFVIPGKKEQPPIAAGPALLKAYEGHYRVTANYTITITSRYGFLYYQPTSQSYGDRLIAKSGTGFYLEEWGDSFIEFRKTPPGQAYDLFIVKPGKTARRCPGVDRPLPGFCLIHATFLVVAPFI